MKVTVLGASGKVGRAVVHELLQQGHTVTAFVHSTDISRQFPEVTVVRGTINNTNDVRQAMTGSDAVICALGSWGTKTKNIVGTGAQAVVEGADGAPLRFVSVTGAGATCAADAQGIWQRLQRRLLLCIAPRILRDGEHHLSVLAASNLRWTCLRSPVMTGSKSTAYKLSVALPGLMATVPRRAVAKALVDQLTDETFINQAPGVHKA